MPIENANLDKWYTKAVFYETCHDDRSGCTPVLWLNDHQITYSGPVEYDENGISDICYRAYDGFMNYENWHCVKLKLDNENPVAFHHFRSNGKIIDDYTSFDMKKGVEFFVDAADFESGLNNITIWAGRKDQRQFLVKKCTFDPKPATTEFCFYKFESFAPGNYTITAKAYDDACNSNISSVDINVKPYPVYCTLTYQGSNVVSGDLGDSYPINLTCYSSDDKEVFCPDSVSFDGDYRIENGKPYVELEHETGYVCSA